MIFNTKQFEEDIESFLFFYKIFFSRFTRNKNLYEFNHNETFRLIYEKIFIFFLEKIITLLRNINFCRNKTDYIISLHLIYISQLQ